MNKPDIKLEQLYRIVDNFNTVLKLFWDRHIDAVNTVGNEVAASE